MSPTAATSVDMVDTFAVTVIGTGAVPVEMEVEVEMVDGEIPSEPQDEQRHHHHGMTCARGRETAVSDADRIPEPAIDEELVAAQHILEEPQWAWLQDKLQAMRSQPMATQMQRFFLRLLRATNADASALVLDDMQAWRTSLTADAKKRLRREQRDGLQALFLLGMDKHMHLQREHGC